MRKSDLDCQCGRYNIMVTLAVNLNRGDIGDVYCGRAGKGVSGYFGNPFAVGDISRDEACDKFEVYFYQRIATDPEYKLAVEGLRGKLLECFCSPMRCHVMTIVKYLEGIDENQQRANYSAWRLEKLKSSSKKGKREATPQPGTEDMFPE